MQCGKDCVTDQEALVTDEHVMEALLESIDACGGDLDAVDFPVCAECTKPLWFNQIGTPDYQEEGYLPQWRLYAKWLQGTLNRQLLVLELGVGMQFPQIIRFPFEKAAFFNQKARFFRVHSRLYQLTEELKERGVSVAQDPADFLLGARTGSGNRGMRGGLEQAGPAAGMTDPVNQDGADDGSGDDRDN